MDDFYLILRRFFSTLTDFYSVNYQFFDHLSYLNQLKFLDDFSFNLTPIFIRFTYNLFLFNFRSIFHHFCNCFEKID